MRSGLPGETHSPVWRLAQTGCAAIQSRVNTSICFLAISLLTFCIAIVTHTHPISNTKLFAQLTDECPNVDRSPNAQSSAQGGGPAHSPSGRDYREADPVRGLYRRAPK